MTRSCAVDATRVAWFADEHDLLAAVADCRTQAFAVLDVHSPWPVHGLDQALGLRRSRLPWVTLAAGVAGLALGTWLQYWASAVDWPLNVAGKPFDSLPAFVPVMFELTILGAGVATFLFCLGRSRLWPGRAPAAAVARASDDRLALVVARRAGAPEWPAFAELCARHHAVAIDDGQEARP